MDQTRTTLSRSGSRWLLFVGLILAAAGAVFVVVLWTAWQRAEETRRWVETPCRVLSSQLLTEQASPNSPTKHRVIVRYEYQTNGITHLSERIRRIDGAKGNRDDAEALRQRFLPGQQTTCWVNPRDPTLAILQHDTRAALYTLWFPLLFVLGGLRMAWAAWRA